jgi:DNA methyltransferase 1-associated protein 1
MLSANKVTDALHCIVRADPPMTASATKSAHTPAYLRSFKLPTPKQAIAPKVTQALAELGILHTRLVMPTRDNCAQLEQLVEATTTLIEMKRLVDKVDYDIEVLKTRLGLRDSQGAEAINGEGGEAMEIDAANEPEEIGEDGRSQSIVSTRSRKHVSMSSSRKG